MAILGTHLLLYTSEPEALRAMLRDTFGFSNVDAGDGWLIFAMPPAEMGVHPADGPTYASGTLHQVSFMCDDIHATVADLRARGVRIDGEPKDQGWGISVMMTLPGGCMVQLYQPRHTVAIARSFPTPP
jgi:catechol 2,3-dioxygenase-like lactoylglutathione lyase family enzyme